MPHFLGAVLLLVTSGSVYSAQPTDVDYSVGVAFAIEPDGDFSDTQRLLVRVTPEGKLSMRAPDRASRVEVQPRVSFFWETDGTFRRTVVELGNKISNHDVGISTRPIVVLGEDGSSWLVVPSSLLPRVNGFSPASIPGTTDGTRDLLRAFNVPTKREKATRLFAAASEGRSADRPIDFSGAACVNTSDSPVPAVPVEATQVTQALNFKLREPSLRWREPSGEERDSDAFQRAWRRFTADNPGLVLAPPSGDQSAH